VQCGEQLRHFTPFRIWAFENLYTSPQRNSAEDVRSIATVHERGVDFAGKAEEG
jgi:hypothetical protein